MSLMPAKIAAVESLANGFTQLSLESECFENIKPGHYFILANHYASYAFKKKPNQAQFIIAPHVSLPLQEDTITISAPMGETFFPPHSDRFNVLISEGESLNACLFYLKEYRHSFKGIAFIGAEAFPFFACPSRTIIADLPSNIIASLPLLEDWGIANRLASSIEAPGCFLGTAAELADIWLEKTKRNNVFRLKFPTLICL